ncbi:MAG: multi-sensor hybrid histidine kinase, partial [Akkermansiaceae bacterium]|nr:multi-sensor hybrid histidine kinase [Akkermansiaceae bacterium]
MDYLIFAIGLFLLAASLGAVFHSREEKGRSVWTFLVVGLISLGSMGWVDLADFASGTHPVISVVRIALGAIAAASLTAFAVEPAKKHTFWPAPVKWLLVLTVFTLALVTGWRPIHFRGEQLPIFLITGSAAAFIGGLRIASHLWSRPASERQTRVVARIGVGLAFMLVTVVEYLPGTISTIFDVDGLGLEAKRIWLLSAVVAAAIDSVVIAFLVWSIKSRDDDNPLRKGGSGSIFIAVGFLVTVSYGAWLTHWLGNQAESEQTATLLSAIRLGASTLDGKEIEQLRGEPEEITEPSYLALRPKLLQIRAALPETRFVYIAGVRREELIYLVDAEPLESSEFSPPGEVVEKGPLKRAKWYAAMNGKPDFNGPDHDDYGTWYTAIIPIYASGNPKPVAVIGVDYPSSEWVKPMAARRLAAMGVTFSASCLLLALLSFHIISSEKNRRVDSLSERLSDAMNAAELDTWEWSPGLRKLSLGPRVSSVLETPDLDTLSHLWRRIHPAERRHLLHLVKHPAGRMRNSFEAEIRLCDSARHYRWYMLRGRVVEVDANGNPARVVGTILNIDASFRARLEIERQRRFAQHVMESVPNGLAVVGATGRITYANPAFS